MTGPQSDGANGMVRRFASQPAVPPADGKAHSAKKRGSGGEELRDEGGCTGIGMFREAFREK